MEPHRDPSIPDLLAAKNLRFAYGEHVALHDVTLTAKPRELIALLGPNGSGKSTLFRLLATLIPVQGGSATIGGFDLTRSPSAVRGMLGVTFQSPSLDLRLTVEENLWCQGHLYGLTGKRLHERISEVLSGLSLEERRWTLADKLSGGLKRRVELAKCLLHRPHLLLLDEPTTGLDPRARLELFALLDELRTRDGLTVVLTTHLMDEAERADRVYILDAGHVVASGTPLELTKPLGDRYVTVTGANLPSLADRIRAMCAARVDVFPNEIRITGDLPPGLIDQLATTFGDEVQSLSLSRPQLEDVFLQATGRRFQEVIPVA